MKINLELCKKCPFLAEDEFYPQKHYTENHWFTTRRCLKHENKSVVFWSHFGDVRKDEQASYFQIPEECHFFLEHFLDNDFEK